jgi:hypothetical protein
VAKRASLIGVLLRLVEVGDCVDLLAACTSMTEGLVVKRGPKHPLARRIDPSRMIHAAIDLCQPDSAFQFQGRRRLTYCQRR